MIFMLQKGINTTLLDTLLDMQKPANASQT